MSEGAALTSEVCLVSLVGQQKLHKMFSLCAPLASSMRMVSYVHIRRGRASAARCSRWEKHVCSLPLHNQTRTTACQPFVGHYIYHNYLHTSHFVLILIVYTERLRLQASESSLSCYFVLNEGKYEHLEFIWTLFFAITDIAFKILWFLCEFCKRCYIWMPVLTTEIQKKNLTSVWLHILPNYAFT